MDKGGKRKSYTIGRGTGRLLRDYKSINVTEKDIELRNDADVIAVGKKMYAKRVLAATLHWPVDELDVRRYTVVPICNYEYLTDQTDS